MTAQTQDRITTKLTSGQFIATVATCIIWSILAYRDRLSPEFNGGAILMVLTSYFNRKRDEAQ